MSLIKTFESFTNDLVDEGKNASNVKKIEGANGTTSWKISLKLGGTDLVHEKEAELLISTLVQDKDFLNWWNLLKPDLQNFKVHNWYNLALLTVTSHSAGGGLFNARPSLEGTVEFRPYALFDTGNSANVSLQYNVYANTGNPSYPSDTDAPIKTVGDSGMELMVWDSSKLNIISLQQPEIFWWKKVNTATGKVELLYPNDIPDINHITPAIIYRLKKRLSSGKAGSTGTGSTSQNQGGSTGTGATPPAGSTTGGSTSQNQGGSTGTGATPPAGSTDYTGLKLGGRDTYGQTGADHRIKELQLRMQWLGGIVEVELNHHGGADGFYGQFTAHAIGVITSGSQGGQDANEITKEISDALNVALAKYPKTEMIKNQGGKGSKTIEVESAEPDRYFSNQPEKMPNTGYNKSGSHGAGAGSGATGKTQAIVANRNKTANGINVIGL